MEERNEDSKETVENAKPSLAKPTNYHWEHSVKNNTMTTVNTHFNNSFKYEWPQVSSQKTQAY